MHASRRPCVPYPSVAIIHILVKFDEKYFFNKSQKKDAQIKPPIGINIRECVNCLWYSRNKRGSLFDLMKISRSGAMPDKKPMRATTHNLELFFTMD